MKEGSTNVTLQRKLLLLSPVGAITLVIVYMSYQPRTVYLPGIETHSVHDTCPNVLKHMLTGSWATRRLIKKEEDEIEAFLLQGLYAVNGSDHFELPDKRCGNLGYYPVKSQEEMASWTRVMCDPRGSSPCCYDNKCQMKTIKECMCQNCYDLRPQIHAEYSKWNPDDARCQVKTFSPNAACELLQGGTFHFYGDSIVRMMFLALIIILKGDKQYGGLRPDAPIDIKKACSGMYVFPTRNCRPFLDYSPTLCNGTVTVVFRHHPRSQDVPKMRRDVKEILGQPKSIIFFGAGVWQHFDRLDMKIYALAVISLLKGNSRMWPQLIWSGFHSFGLWHRHVVPTSDNAHVEPFNRYMEDLVGAFNVPVFDTFNMTKGVRSVDGTHYGPGVNFVKAQIFLNYILELKRQGKWK